MKRLKGQLTALIIGLILLIFSLISQKTDTITGTKEWIRILSNSALIPGVLLTGLGVIVRISDEGFFDGIKYSMSSILTHVRREPKRYASFFDYMKREKKAAANPLLLPGLIYLVIAIILTGIYYVI